MRSSLWNEPWIGIIGRWGLAILVLSVLFALSAMPFEVAHLGEVRPAFMMMAVYYWTILRPLSFPPPVVFAVGLLLDLLSAYPFGLHALVLVLAQWLTRRSRKFLLGQAFPVIWAGFALLELGARLIQWAVFALFNLALFPLKPALMSALLSFLLFPLIVLPLAKLHKALAENPSTAV